jgi:outer membrane protein assembly factor BamB
MNITDSVFSYKFFIGINKLKLIVTDNDGASDTSVTTIKISSLVKQFAGGFLGGITAVGPNIIYTADTSYNQITGASIYNLDSKGDVSYPISVNSKIFTTPSVSSDSSVFITNGSNINAFGKTGAPLWSTIPLGGISYVTPTVDSILNNIYLGVSNKNFFAINYKTGKIAWNLIGDAPINSSAVISGNRRLFFTSELGTLYGFDIKTNKVQTEAYWKYNLEEVITRSPAIDNKYHLYFGSDSGHVFKVVINDDGTVKKLWTKSLGSPIKTSPVIDADGAIYVGNDNGDLVKLDSATGQIIWSFPTGGAIRSTPSISEYGTIYVANMNGDIYALKTDKTIRWKYQTDAPISSNLLYINNSIYVGSEGGKLISLYDNVFSNTVKASSVSSFIDNKKTNSSSLGNIIRSNAIDSSTFVIKNPIWGTFQGNYKRNGSQALECPDLPIINLPDCSNKADSILVTTNNLTNKIWIINDSAYTKLLDTVIKVKSNDNVKLRATNIYGCVVNSSNTGIIVGSSITVPTIISSTSKNSFCEGDSLKLSSTVSANSYTWSNTTNVLSKVNSLNVKQAGTYTLAVSNIYGCISPAAKFDVVVTKIPSTPSLSRDANGNLVSSSIYNTIWYKDAQLISDTTKTIKPTSPGNYSTKANNNGCLSALSNNYYFLTTDIININNREYIKVNPNPIVNLVNFDFVVKGYQYFNLDIFSLSSGNKISSKQNIYSGDQISCESLPGGVYLFRLTSSDNKLSYQFKMVKL